jgi:glucokinase
MVEQQKRAVASIDIGGTNISGGLIDGDGRVLFRMQKSTQASMAAERVLENITSVADQLVKIAQANSIAVNRMGLATAGQVDPDTGTITYATDTIPGWTGVAVKDRLECSTGLTTFVENDAFAAGWGEKVFGVAHDSQDFVMMTLGTGVGGAVFVKGRLLPGSTGLAGLIGHVSIDPDGMSCICGGRGCLEAYVSGTGIAKAAREAIGAESESLLAEIASASLGDITAKDVFDAAKYGDPIAMSIVMRTAKYLGTGIGGLITLLNPELIIIGGGVSNAGSLLLDPTLESVKSHCSPAAFAKATVCFSRFLDDCGLMGAAAIAYTCGIPRI